MLDEPSDTEREWRALLELSARLGRNPFFVQASTGNTSIKIGETLWVKASGTWLSDADRVGFLVPVNLPDALDCVYNDRDPTRFGRKSEKNSRASIETAMHAVLPHRIVIHVHSINVIAWAVRVEAACHLARVLDGMRWRWIPYVDSGVPLAQAVKRQSPEQTNIFVLGNHGLIVCGDTCRSVEMMLREVDHRLKIEPDNVGSPDFPFLCKVAACGPWRLPDDDVLHSLGLGSHRRSILAGGILYPCQAIFWQTSSPGLFTALPANRVTDCKDSEILSRPFLIIEERGVLLGKGISAADYAILLGLAHVLQRIPVKSSIRYLTGRELASLQPDCGSYRAIAQQRGVSPSNQEAC